MGKGVWRFFGLLEPMIGETQLHAVELRVDNSEICIRDVRPTEANIERLAFLRPQVNSSATLRHEVETGGVARREVRWRGDRASRQFDIRRNPRRVQGGVPAQDHGIETEAVGALISVGLEDRHHIEGILEAAPPPAAKVFARDYPASRHASGPDLRFRE